MAGFANTRGLVSQTAGVLTHPPGAWQVCFLAVGQTVTGAVTYMVAG